MDIPAGPLSTSLAAFSRITGLSIGLPGAMPRATSRRVSGAMSADAALRRLLRGTGLRAVRLGAAVYRIEPAPAVRQQPVEEPPSPPPGGMETPAADIVVTAQKRPQFLANVPLSISVLAAADMPAGIASPESRNIVSVTEGLAMTNLGPGRNRQFIRGVADSPFNGLSQSTVAVQMDEARVTYDAPDPDLRLFDIDRVEILKGPQGPLYGSGALGGIYHIVTRKPDLDAIAATARLTSEAVQHGGIGGGVDAVINMPIVDDRLAIRFVGYRSYTAGWIDNVNRRDDTNSSRTLGGRLALRWRPSDDWTVDVGGTLQDLNVNDSQYVLASDDTLERDNAIAEPNDNDFRMVNATVRGQLGDMRLLYAASFIDHDVDYTLEATAASPFFGLSGPSAYRNKREYKLFNQEVRLSGGRWLAGLSYMHAKTHDIGTIQQAQGSPQAVSIEDRSATEYAAFGEASFRLFSMIDATVGARLYHSVTSDEDTQDGRREFRLHKTVLSPSMSLSMPLSDRGLVYLRYARALRPGGLAASGPANETSFASDELGTVDLGVRRASRDGRFSVSASLYYTIWTDIQSDYLLPNGLVSTRNAGRGRIVGAEAAVEWTIGGGFTLAAGASAQSTRLTHAEDDLELDDRRLPIAPDITGRIILSKAFDLGDWRAQISGQANYIGHARLTFDQDLDRKMGNYTLYALNASMARGPFTLTGRIDNLFDVKGDNSFAFGNPFSIRAAEQYTPLRPRTLTLSVSRAW
ncbi:TonB-dependent receptor domain-containing protein [Sphingobium phenoxybenzoativorans]|uniref:TonB-dependent receptor domain-containing protein n=1 Tax=Sphingobium phenoxybenzoativorans TaxID=1592790 RepID=UPI000A520403|nr:TonB-dependent receptor [Sphingobium phenoxybenzoativorans]